LETFPAKNLSMSKGDPGYNPDEIQDTEDQEEEPEEEQK
jgi:hypothetical protein